MLAVDLRRYTNLTPPPTSVSRVTVTITDSSNSRLLNLSTSRVLGLHWDIPPKESRGVRR